MIDLHQHSNHSDGSESVESLIKTNRESGIKYFSLTDHDTISGSKEILNKHIKNDGNINYFTGIELSTQDNGHTVHLLVYDYDINNKKINALINKALNLRKNRIETRIKLLKSEFNIELNSKDLDIINNSSNPNKPMLAQMLINYGYGNNINDVMKKYLYHKLPSSKLSSEEVLKALKNEDVICSIAHPLGGIGEKRVDMSVLKERLQRFVMLGLKGIEIYYSLYNEEERSQLINLAKQYNLLISGGSDFHGTVKNVKVGELSCDGYVPQKQEFTILKNIKRFYKI